MLRRTAVLLSAVMGAACLAEPPPEEHELRAQAIFHLESPYGFCPTEGCGTNSPDVLVGLDLRGRVDDAPFWFAGAFIDEGGSRRPANFTVDGDEILVDGDPVLFRYEDVNPYTDTRLVIVIKRDTGAEYELKLIRQGGAEYHASPYDWASSYQLIVEKTVQGSEESGGDRAPLGEASPLCLRNLPDPAVGERPEPVWAFFFSGDRYDGPRKRVLPGEPTRFHIACSETALAKLLLFRHTEVGSARPATARPVGLPERQALLKLITADYCGDGRSFTSHGQLINFALANNSWKGLHRPETPIDLTETEAIWGPEGAVCLNEPRAARRSDIVAHCQRSGREIPTCGSEQTHLESWKAFGHAISVHLHPPSD